MDLSFVAAVLSALGTEASLRVYRRISDARAGLPASEFSQKDLAILDELGSVGLVRRIEGGGASWYEANQLLLVKALAAVVA